MGTVHFIHSFAFHSTKYSLLFTGLARLLCTSVPCFSFNGNYCVKPLLVKCQSAALKVLSTEPYIYSLLQLPHHLQDG